MSKWIKVSDRLPEHYGDVLIAYKGIDILGGGKEKVAIDIGYHKKGLKTWHYKDNDKLLHCVTHWMPLPERPKRDGK